MRVLIFAIVLAACSGGSGVATTIQQWAEANDVSAVAVAISEPTGSMKFYGASNDGRPPVASSLFEVGSLTKTMVAATALLLAEEAVLDLDATIDRWLPDFPRAGAITLRQLLTHTAGLKDGGDEEPDLSDLGAFLEVTQPRDLIEAAARSVGAQDLPAPHGYANSGYWVAGAVIEAATSESLADVMRRLILDPLALDDTYLAWSEAVPRDLVPGELAGPGGNPLVLGVDVIAGVVSSAWAAGGVVSSAADMATFYSGLFDGLLAPPSLAQLTEPTGSSGYGMGIDSRQRGWGHNGGIPGYTASAVVTDDGWTVVALANRFQVTPSGLQPDVEALVGVVVAEVGR